MRKRFLPLSIAALTLAVLLLFASCRKSGGGSGADIPEGMDEDYYNSDEYKNLPDNPVDFESWQNINNEIYAFITIPGTNIDYPILQSGKNDNYYLKRSYRGTYSYRGAIYTQSHNSVDFSDPVTVIYGHNTDKGDMFSELLKFKDAEFFNEHDTFTICLPHRMLTYRIISSHTYDDSHILNTHDFTDEQVLIDFQKTIAAPETFIRNVRAGTELNITNKLVILSTCAEPHSGGTVRYLVNGVLINDEKTK